jgi:Domain of unknown function (DUF4129)
MSNMLSLLALSNRALPSATHAFAQKREAVPSRSALRLLLALFIVLLLENIAAAGPLSNYAIRVHNTAIELTALEQWAKVDSPAEHAARVATTLQDVRKALPAEETVEWEGGTVRVNNSWLAAELQTYEEMSPTDPQRASVLTRIIERVHALDDRLTELDGQRKSVKEGTATGATKDQEKARLETILRRDEFVEKPPEESTLSRWWKRFLEWWSRLFPRSSGLAPGQMSWLSFIALIFVFTLAAGALGYAIWKLVPFFERRRARFKLEKREARIVLGERLSPEQTAADLMSEAEALARRGELRAAIRKAYIAALCELGDRKVITLSQHKTNRDYLRALREKRNLLGEMQKLTNSFENHWYGFQQATPEDWTSFRTGFQKIMSYEF